MRELYEAVKQELTRIDFNAIWTGFTPIPFALVGSDQVYLDGREIPLGDRFWANTVIMHEDEMVATWCVDKPSEEDVQMLAANLVHEMFHAFQSTQKRERNSGGGDEFTLLSYPDDLAAYRIKAAEANLLARAYIDSDITALTQFISLRKSRAQLLGDIISCEYWAEDGEGMAEFAGLCALEQLSTDKFEKYVTEMHLQMLINPAEKLFSVRFMAYFTGSVLCLALKRLGIDFCHVLTDPCPLFEAISGTDGIADDFNKYYSAKKAKFDDFLAGSNNVIEKSGTITGMDPMNMWRMGDQILCARFISIDGENIPGPVMLNMAKGSGNQIVGIVKSN